MKKHKLRNMFIAGSVTLALAASAILVPSVADAAAPRPGGHAGGHAGAYARGHFRVHRGPGWYGGYYGGYYVYCGPIQFALGLCGPYYPYGPYGY